MPVRKIPKNHLFVTGGYSSRKNQQMDAFESLLEKDYLLLLDFDDTVDRFETQPVRIPVPGVPNGYVPDVLVFFLPFPQTGAARKPILVDVKHSDEMKRNEGKYAPKFAAAREFAEKNGWEFEIIDQTQIRTPRLANLKFLREYRNVIPAATDIQRVLEYIGDRQTSSLALLDALTRTSDERLYWLPVIWCMLLNRYLTTNLDQLFADDVPLWSAGENA